MTSAAWDGQDQAMTSTTDEDFHQFINMASLGDGMHFDFQGFPDGSGQALMNQPRDPPDTIMTDTENPGLMSVANSMPMSTSTGQPTIPAHMMTPASDPISNIDAQIQYLQQQKFQQQQRQMQEQQAAFFHNHNHSVPPTPQSLEMPNSGQFYSQAEQVSQPGVYDRGYQRMKDQQDQMAFTPLVSPAVTPLDPGFPMSDSFVAQNPYFSPLTSPALIPQNDHSCAYNTNSPIEMDPENPGRPVSSAMDLSKKTRRKAAAKSSRKGSVRSSPIVKPQRQKIRPSPAIVSQVLNEVDESNGALLPMPATSTETSAEENSSVSPEALTDMPPPPIPNRRSTSKSPYIQAQMGGQQTPISAPVDAHPAPATPASLMKLPASKANKQAAGHHEPAVSEHIESLELPESVSGGKTHAPVISRVSIQSPIVESNPGKGSGFQPLPSPVFPKPSGPASASASPQLAPGSTGPSARKTPQLAPRSNRKRSTGSVHVSPALLPRISPSIKPLLPGTPGMTSAESAASQLLMSKSNYQNILEGNKVPGVSYPSELSTNLTSKRTSHKIAEQGRRNRINSALQIMAGLLPGGDKGSASEDADKKEGKQANAQNSKASVVENAIVHLKNLEQENVDLKKELEELKKQLEGMKGAEG
ncbi:hypothetical protein ACHAPT_007443 [Fusarium lateritium]